MKVNRRKFLQTTATVVAGTTSGIANATANAAVGAGDPNNKTSFHASHYGPFHGVVRDGKFIEAQPIKDIDARPTKMLTQGVVERTYAESRIHYPFVRKSYLEGYKTGDIKPELRGKEEFVRVDWETALNLTSKAILDTIDELGNEGIFSSSYGGWSHAGVFRPQVLQGRFFNLIGGQSTTTGDYSAGASQVLMPLVLGDMEVYSAQTSWEQLRDHSEVVVFIGCDPHKNNRIEFRVADHGMYPGWEAIKQAGVKFISINPQETTTDEWLGSEWVKIVPNTDIALFSAMAYHVLEKGLESTDFLKKYTVGSEKWIAYLKGESDDKTPKTPEWAEKYTQIPASKIRELAELFASKRTQFCGSWAIQRAQYGETTHWAIVNFAALIGNIGLPGQGVGFSWHYGNGGMAASGLSMPVGLSQGKNPVKAICPASRISEMLFNPGKKFTYNGGEFAFPKVGMIYNAGNNFASHQQNTNELIQALNAVKTVVVQDPWWCASTRWADIVLPATTTVERDEITSGGTYSNDKVYAMKKLIEPLGESKDDYEIFQLLARKFNVEIQFTDGKDIMTHIKEAYGKSSATQPFDEFWKLGFAKLPVPEAARTWVRHADFRNDPEKNPLHTPTGKIEMYSKTIEDYHLPDYAPYPRFVEVHEYLGNAKPRQLHIVSPHPYYRLHSQMANAKSLWDSYQVNGHEPIRINSEDAKKYGIKAGDLVEIYNDRGTVIAGAVLSDRIMPGVMSLYEGQWPQLDSKGRDNGGLINFVTSSQAASHLNQACTANTCLVSIRKCTDPESDSQAHAAPKTLVTDIKVASAEVGLERAAGLREKIMANMSPGEKLFYERCTICHGPKEPSHLTKQQWNGITESMFPRAGLNDEEKKIVLNFLHENAKDAVKK